MIVAFILACFIAFSALANPNFSDLGQQIIPVKCSRLTIGNGKIFTTDSEGIIKAFQLSNDRRILWTIKIPGLPPSSLVFDRDVLYVSAADNIIYAIDANQGKILWQKELAGPIRGKIALRDGMIFLRSAGDVFYGISAEDGIVLWTRGFFKDEIERSGSAPVLALDRVAILPQSSGVFSAVDIQTADIIWEQRLGSKNHAQLAYNALMLLAYIDENKAVVSEFSGRTAVFNTRDGRIIWSDNLDAFFAAAASKGNIFLLSERRLVSVQAGNGNIQWSVDLPEASSELFLSSGVEPYLWVVTRAGYLLKFDCSNGELIARAKTISNAESASIEDKLYLFNGNKLAIISN
jgi:outer membrane protein assembly factor BamB